MNGGGTVAEPSQAPCGPLSVVLALVFTMCAGLAANGMPSFDRIGEIVFPLLFIGWLSLGVLALRHQQRGWFVLGSAIMMLPFVALLALAAPFLIGLLG